MLQKHCSWYDTVSLWHRFRNVIWASTYWNMNELCSRTYIAIAIHSKLSRMLLLCLIKMLSIDRSKIIRLYFAVTKEHNTKTYKHTNKKQINCQVCHWNTNVCDVPCGFIIFSRIAYWRVTNHQRHFVFLHTKNLFSERNDEINLQQTKL